MSFAACFFQPERSMSFARAPKDVHCGIFDAFPILTCIRERKYGVASVRRSLALGFWSEVLVRTDVYGLYERFGGLRQKRRMEMSRLKSRYAHFRNSAPAESYRFYPSRISEMPEVFPVRLDGGADVPPPFLNSRSPATIPPYPARWRSRSESSHLRTRPPNGPVLTNQVSFASLNRCHA